MHLRAQTYDPGYNYRNAVGTIEPYGGTDHTVRRMVQLAKGDRGERSIRVRRHAEQIVANIRPKDYLSEMIAVCRWWTNAGRYTRDPVHIEMMKDPQTMIEDSDSGRLAIDCDEQTLGIGASCLVLGAPVQFLTVGFEAPRMGRPKKHTHVLVRGQDPRTKIWWILDPVAGRKTAPMLARVKQFTIFNV